VERQADNALADSVVDLAGEPPPLGFLEQHDPLSEPLQRLFPLGEPAVQARILNNPGHQTRYRAQQLDVGLGELAAVPGVHVEHPDKIAWTGHHRHRGHRGELLPA
jgi:hypothetical protein